VWGWWVGAGAGVEDFGFGFGLERCFVVVGSSTGGSRVSSSSFLNATTPGQ
jgi:hypothetical protein